MEKRLEDLTIENARICCRNFRGREIGKFIKAGNRSFSVIIPDISLAEELINLGWNVKIMDPRTPDEEPLGIMQVAVSYNPAATPPSVFVVREGDFNNIIPLDETTIGELDNVSIVNTDLIIHPYCWEVNGNHGVKAYLKTMYVTIENDPFYDKYHNSPNEDVPF